MKFKGDNMAALGLTNYISESTRYGDWSCSTWSTPRKDVEAQLEELNALGRARWELMKQAHKQRASQINPSLYTVRKAPLWAALALTAGASVPNMLDVTFAMKSSYLVSICLTMAFTSAPFLLIMARVKGVFAWMVVVGVMGYTGFCNTASIFGGLTALDVGYVLKPTVFLESVTNLLNTDYLNTARALSGLMALFIGSIEFVAFKNLSK